jgi:hypothetical protein
VSKRGVQFGLAHCATCGGEFQIIAAIRRLIAYRRR